MKNKISFIALIVALPILAILLLLSVFYYNHLKSFPTENELWSQIQSYKSVNSKPYIKDESLCEIASTRIPEVLQTEALNHEALLIRSQAVMDKYHLETLGENLVKEGMWGLKASPPLQIWLKSPAHRANLDNPEFTHSCLKCSGNICVHIFGSY